MTIGQLTDQKLQSRKAYFGMQGVLFMAVALLYVLSFAIKYSDVQTRKDASGFEHHYAARFFYFYYYTGHFPLATLDTNLTYTKEAALHEIEDHGKQLMMEYKHWSRLGEHGRIWCYLPDAWLKCTAAEPSIRLFNALMFLLGLCCLYRGFYLMGKPVMGLLFCIAVLCTPFFHFEVFRQTNIFALQSSVFFTAAGCLLPFLENKLTVNLKNLFILFFSAAVIGLCSEIRNEISVVLACVIVLLLCMSKTPWKQQLFCIIFVMMAFWGVKKSIHTYFNFKYQQTKLLVSKRGGHVYTGKKIEGHKFWHPVFCGLGDYDHKYGYAWNDTVAYEYAVPVLNAKYGLNLQYSGKLHTDNYYDKDSLYYVKFDEIPAYETVVQQKVLRQIAADPLWYLHILFRRILKILTATLPFPLLGFAALAALIIYIKQRKWLYVKLLLITGPLSATTLLIYSGRGATYNALFGYMVLVVILYELLFRLNIKKRYSK